MAAPVTSSENIYCTCLSIIKGRKNRHLTSSTTKDQYRELSVSLLNFYHKRIDIFHGRRHQFKLKLVKTTVLIVFKSPHEIIGDNEIAAFDTH